MAHNKIIDSVKKHGQVAIKDLDEFLRFVINESDMRTYDDNYISILIPMKFDILLRRYLKTTNYNKEYINMELKLSSNFSGKPVSVVVPIEKVIEVFWPKDEKPPISLTVSTVLGADSANAEFSLGEETKESYPGIWLTTDNVKSHRHCSWFRL